MVYKPFLIIVRDNPIIAIVLTHKFWRKASKLGVEDKVLDIISDLVQCIYEKGATKGLNDPKVSRSDNIRRIRLGKYRLFYKVDHMRKWIVFFDIDKRKEHTYREERTFNSYNLLW